MGAYDDDPDLALITNPCWASTAGGSLRILVVSIGPDPVIRRSEQKWSSGSASTSASPKVAVISLQTEAQLALRSHGFDIRDRRATCGFATFGNMTSEGCVRPKSNCTRSHSLPVAHNPAPVRWSEDNPR